MKQLSNSLNEATKRVRVERTVRRDHPGATRGRQAGWADTWQRVLPTNPQCSTPTWLAPGRLSRELLAYRLRSHPPGVAAPCHAVPRGNLECPKARTALLKALLLLDRKSTRLNFSH